MATCPYCGAQLEHDDDRFCGICGAAISMSARLSPPTPPEAAPSATIRPEVARPPVPPASSRSKALPILLVAILGVILLACIVGCVLLVVVGGVWNGGASIVLTNATPVSICYVYISPSTDNSWGDDQLGANETIAPGGSRTFRVSPGTYDLQAQDCSHNPMSLLFGQSVNGTYYWYVP